MYDAKCDDFLFCLVFCFLLFIVLFDALSILLNGTAVFNWIFSLENSTFSRQNTYVCFSLNHYSHMPKKNQWCLLPILIVFTIIQCMFTITDSDCQYMCIWLELMMILRNMITWTIINENECIGSQSLWNWKKARFYPSYSHLKDSSI